MTLTARQTSRIRRPNDAENEDSQEYRKTRETYPFEETSCVFISEPQLWYQIGQFFNCPNLHIGGEVELAYNFAGAWRKEYVDNKGFNVSPCLGLKWIF